MASPVWSLSGDERTTLEQVIDALLPPTGSFPLPSQTGLIDEFIMERVPAEDEAGSLYPGLDAPRLKALLSRLNGARDMTEALSDLQQQQPDSFQSLWSLTVYGYYSRSETIAAIQRDLAPAYHGAPLGSYIPTDQVRPVDLSTLASDRSDE